MPVACIQVKKLLLWCRVDSWLGYLSVESAVWLRWRWRWSLLTLWKDQ